MDVSGLVCNEEEWFERCEIDCGYLSIEQLFSLSEGHETCNHTHLHGRLVRSRCRMIRR